MKLYLLKNFHLGSVNFGDVTIEIGKDETITQAILFHISTDLKFSQVDSTKFGYSDIREVVKW